MCALRQLLPELLASGTRKSAVARAGPALVNGDFMFPHVPFGPRRPSFVCALLLGLLASTQAGCGSETANTPDIVEEAPPSPPVQATPDPALEACNAETAKLQAGLDKAHRATTDAVLAVKTPSCGLRVVTSGPSKLDGTKLHRIGSVTKTYVAAVILTLAKDGALGLDDAVGRWVEGVPGGDAITVRQLLRHASGLFNYTEDKTFLTTALTEDRTWSPRELLDVAFAHPPYFEPGTGWHYSNTNYILLGMIAEVAGKAKIGPLVRSRVLTKVGASATFFDGEEPVAGELATGRSARGKDITRNVGPSWAWAAGAIVASPADIVTWVEHLGGGTFYDGATQTELLKTVATDVGTMRYGLGIMVFDERATGGAGIGYGHAGDIPGYHTQSFYFPQKQTTVVSIVDSDAESANDVTVIALEVLFPPN